MSRKVKIYYGTKETGDWIEARHYSGSYWMVQHGGYEIEIDFMRMTVFIPYTGVTLMWNFAEFERSDND